MPETLTPAEPGPSPEQLRPEFQGQEVKRYQVIMDDDILFTIHVTAGWATANWGTSIW